MQFLLPSFTSQTSPGKQNRASDATTTQQFSLLLITHEQAREKKLFFVCCLHNKRGLPMSPRHCRPLAILSLLVDYCRNSHRSRLLRCKCRLTSINITPWHIKKLFTYHFDKDKEHNFQPRKVINLSISDCRRVVCCCFANPSQLISNLVHFHLVHGLHHATASPAWVWSPLS